MEELKFFAQFGVGAVAAVMLFMIYRADRKASEDRFADLTKEFRTIVQDNTAAITKLTDALEHNVSGGAGLPAMRK
jgi:hypothetical protein